MSSKTTNIFEESFDTYADALYKYLESKGIELKWLAEKTTPKGQKVKSTQEKFSTWKREGSKPGKGIRRKIDEILGVSIEFKANGKWEVSRTESGNSVVDDKYEKEFNRLSGRLNEEGSPYNAEDLLLEALEEEADKIQNDLQGLVSRIRKIRMLKKSDD